MRIDSSIRGRRKRRWNNNIIITIFIPIIFFKQFNFIAMKIFSRHSYYTLVRKNPIFRRFPSKDSKDIPEKNFLNVISFTIIVHKTVKRERNYSFSLDIVCKNFQIFQEKYPMFTRMYSIGGERMARAIWSPLYSLEEDRSKRYPFPCLRNRTK